MVVTKRLTFLVILGGLVIISFSFFFSSLLIFTIWNFVLLFLLIKDYKSLPSSDLWTVRREVPRRLSIGVPNTVTLIAANDSSWPFSMEITDDYPRPFLASRDRFHFHLFPGENKNIEYYVTPLARGDYKFKDIWCRIFSPLGLLGKQIRVSSEIVVKVYPNFLAVSKYELFARKGRLNEVGFKPSRYKGQGTAFESLRDYLPDDDFRKINWKATARRGKLIAQEYETERDQNIIFLIDTARMMVGEFEGLSRLDYAINSAFLLSYVALAKGDKVGLILFSNDIESYLPPRGGKSQLLRITEELYKAKGELVEPDYGKAFRYLSLKHRRRSLVILFTNFFGAGHTRSLVTYINHIHLVHLPICIIMKDATLVMKADSQLVSSQTLYEKAVVEGLLLEKERTLFKLRRAGAIILDLYPKDLSPTLIRTYLEIKLRGRL